MLKTSNHRLPRYHALVRGGFTILELLVVVAIIVVLIAILIPIVSSAQNHALKNATVGQMRTLTFALSQYYSDFSVYPASSGAAYTSVDNSKFPVAGIIPAGRCPNRLAEALTGYLPFDVDGCGPTLYAAAPPYAASSITSDPPFGFRTRAGGNGRIYGPYVATDGKYYRMNSAYDHCFIDSYGHEIVYFRVTNVPNPTKVFNASTASPQDSYFFSDDYNSATPTTPPVDFLNDDAGRTDNLGPEKKDPSGKRRTGTRGFYGMLGLPAPAATDSTKIISPFQDNDILAPTNAANPATGLIGRDSYLLISPGLDGCYFGDDDIIATKP